MNRDSEESSDSDGPPPLLQRQLLQYESSDSEESSDDDGPPPLLQRQIPQYESSDSEESSDDDGPPPLGERQIPQYESSEGGHQPPLVELQLLDEVDELLQSFNIPGLSPSEVLDVYFPHLRFFCPLWRDSFLRSIEAELAERFKNAKEDVSPTSGGTDAALVNNNLNFIFHSLSSCPQGIQQFPKALRISTVHEWQALPDAIKGLLVLSVPNQPPADPWRLFHIMKKCLPQIQTQGGIHNRRRWSHPYVGLPLQENQICALYPW